LRGLLALGQIAGILGPSERTFGSRRCPCRQAAGTRRRTVVAVRVRLLRCRYKEDLRCRRGADSSREDREEPLGQLGGWATSRRLRLPRLADGLGGEVFCCRKALQVLVGRKAVWVLVLEAQSLQQRVSRVD
jgi:hypothetical protein